MFPGGQLGNGSQLISQLRLGALELSLPPDADLASVVPTASITALPFIVSDHQQALNILTGRFGSYIHDAVAKVGLYQFPRSWDGDFLELQTAVRPVSTPSDLRGLKVRTSPSPVEIAVCKACGAGASTAPEANCTFRCKRIWWIATTLPLPFSAEPFKVYELTKYFSYTNHAWVNFTLLMNMDAWRRLPADLQSTVGRNFETARNLANEDVVKGDSAAEGRSQGTRDDLQQRRPAGVSRRRPSGGLVRTMEGFVSAGSLVASRKDRRYAMSPASAAVRERLGHPVIDADGHIVEVVPVLHAYFRELAGEPLFQRYLSRLPASMMNLDGGVERVGGPKGWYGLSRDERRSLRVTRNGFWAYPTGNALDRATVMLPKLFRERLDELGIDFAILYPSMASRFLREPDGEIRRAGCAAPSTPWRRSSTGCTPTA